MPYIDATYYNNTFKGVPIADNTLLERLILRASEDIDQFTGYKITDLSLQPQFIQDQLKKATASQVQHLYEQQLTGGGGEMNVAIGTFKIVTKASTVSTAKYHEDVYTYLSPTGLLYGGVTVL